MLFARRRFFALGPAAFTAAAFSPGVLAPAILAPAVLTSQVALAESSTTDLAVTCDIAAGPAVRAVGLAYRARTGVRIRVFPTAPGLVLPQIARQIQNDIIVTQLATIEQAEKAGLLTADGRAGPWRNRLVTAAAKTPAGPEGSFAVPDASPASDIDGAAVLQHIGAKPDQVLGVLDTEAVAWMLTNGAARQGLLHQTEVTADDRLQAVAAVPDAAWPPILYGATVTKLARRGNPPGFISFLNSPDGVAVLHSAGLESAS